MRLKAVKYHDGRTIRTLWVRQDSSDIVLVDQLFVKTVFNLNQLIRRAEITEFLSAARKSGKRPLIIDAGANIGLASIYFATQCRDALVVAIEPEPANFAMLCRNTQGLPILPVPCALASTPQKVNVVDPGLGFLAFQTRPASALQENGSSIDCVTINEIISEHQDECFPFLVKVDIEGAEKDVFKENISWVERTPVLITELHDWLIPRQGVATPFLRAIAPLDRDFVNLGENIFSIANNLNELLP